MFLDLNIYVGPRQILRRGGEEREKLLNILENL
jgi:hypothetical protein